MKFLIVGLGNPGMDYEHTRHNIGFDILDSYAGNNEINWTKGRFGWTADVMIRGKRATLLKPDTYMNLSGKAVRYWLDTLKIKPQNLLIVLDDLALPLGKLRLKLKGSDGGHNGLRSINEVLNTTEYPRLRFGIGNEFSKGRQVDFVLSKWRPEENEIVAEAIEKATESINLFIVEGAGKAMTKVNA